MALDNHTPFIDIGSRLVNLFDTSDPVIDINPTALSITLAKAYVLCLKSDSMRDKFIESPLAASGFVASFFFQELLNLFDQQSGSGNKNFPTSLPNPPQGIYKTVLDQYPDNDEMLDDALDTILGCSPNVLDLAEDAVAHQINEMIRSKMDDNVPMVVLGAEDFITACKKAVTVVAFCLQMQIEDAKLDIFKESVDGD